MSAWNSNGLTVRTTAATTDTVLATDDVIVYTAGTAKTAALPNAALTGSVQPGKVYRFVNAGAGTVTITPAAGTIDGGANKVMATAPTAATPGTLMIVSDGTNWRSIAYTVGA